MRIIAGVIAGVILAGCGQDGEQQAAPEPRMEILARHGVGAFLENIAVAPDGAVYYTNYTAKTLEVWRPGEGQRTFARLPAHPVSVVVLPEGFAVVAHGASIFDGPQFLTTGRMLRLDRAGAVMAEHLAPQAGFLNGAVALDARTLLVADSANGAIWRYSLEAGSFTPFFADTALSASEDLPGANGLKLAAGALIISSSAKRTIFRLPLESGQPAGPLTPIVTGLPGADDFALLPDGGLVVATHDEAVIRVAPDGAQTVLSRHPAVLGATAVAVIGAGETRRALVLGTGGVTSGGTGEASLVSLPLP